MKTFFSLQDTKLKKEKMSGKREQIFFSKHSYSLPFLFHSLSCLPRITDFSPPLKILGLAIGLTSDKETSHKEMSPHPTTFLRRLSSAAPAAAPGGPQSCSALKRIHTDHISAFQMT